MKYVLPKIEFPFSLDHIGHVLQQHREVLNPYILKQIIIAIRNDLDEAQLFSIPSSNHVVSVVKADFVAKLTALRAQFIADEQYEYVGATDAILRKHMANVLISETLTRM